MSESNAIVVLWKTAVPLLAIIVVASLSFHGSNFTAGGGFAPYGMHGVFAALPAGVVFALQGFEQAVQLAGEARNPKRDLSRAILVAMTIGALLYILLQVVFIGGVLIIDAVVSPSGTGVVYVGTTSRISYALGEESELPGALASTDARGVPVVSILVTAVVGVLCFGPFPSWNRLVGVVTGATALMYAFAPVSLASLHLRDRDRERSYRMPMPKVLLPTAFVSANLILYWGGYEYTWKIAVALVVGLVIFGIGTQLVRTDVMPMLRPAMWIGPWIVGQVIIGALGRYGTGSHSWLPEWIDLLVVVVFSLTIFYWAVRLTMPSEKVQVAIAKDSAQIDYEAAI